ncbi:MAG: YceI family protein, partial [Pseudobdellovibrionaceae bacterium]
ADTKQVMVPAVYYVDSKKSSIEFEAQGRPSFLKVHGKSVDSDKTPDVTGEMSIVNNKLSGEIRFLLTSLDTGIKLRNEHMFDYLEVKKNGYEHAHLKIESQPIDQLVVQGKGVLTVNAKLLLHGETRDLELVINMADLSATSSFPVILTQHKIEIPVKMGITIEDKIAVQANVQFLKK